MTFFTTAEFNAVRNDADLVATLYASRRADFVALLKPEIAALPEDYIKLAFTSLFSYELTPYGNGPTANVNDLHTLLNQPTMMCANYTNLAWLLYDRLSPSGLSDVAQMGWYRGAIGDHAELLIGMPGEPALLLDPTIGLLAVTGGYNALTSGVPVPPTDQQSFFDFRPDARFVGFNDLVQSALADGAYRGGNMMYLYATPEFAAHYGGSNWTPTPQRESVAVLGKPLAETNDFTLGDLSFPNQQTASADAPWLFGTAASDHLHAAGKATVMFGGTQTFDGVSVDPHGMELRAGSFFSAGELAQIRASASAVNTLYGQEKASFLNALGPSFAALPDQEIRLAFAAVLAHELATFDTAAAPVYDLPGLLAAPSLDADGHALLAWRLFQVMVPDPNPLSPAGGPDVSQIGWNGGPVGRAAQLLINVEGAPSLLVDPTIGHIALVQGFNPLTAGEVVPVAHQVSFLTDPALAPARDGVVTALHDGLYRTGNLFYWFSVPDDMGFFMESPNAPGGSYYGWARGSGPQSFATPQGDVALHGDAEPGYIGAIASFNRMVAGPGGDMLVSNGIVNNDGLWTAAVAGHWGWLTGDFDGDGKADIFRIVSGVSGADMFLSTGAAFAHDGSWTGFGAGTQGWYVGDFDGDGKADIFRYVPGTSGADMFLSTGATFARDGSWTGFGSGTQGWYVGDFNGDGMADIFRYVPGTSGADMMLSTGAGFVRDGSWTGFGSGAEGWYVGDFNGDGMDDLLRYNPGGSAAEVFLSTGSGFVHDGSWTGFGHGGSGWFVQDVNGDGKADLVGNALGAPAASVVLLSTGAGFTLTNAWAPQGHGMPDMPMGDFNGDGRPDYLYATGAGTAVLAGTGIPPQAELDQFVFAPGTLDGATIAGFQSGVDQIWFEGFGAGAHLTHAAGMPADYWTLAYSGGSETFRVIGVTNLATDGYLIA